MPSVKGIQEKMGKDKFQVLLLSVDHDKDFSEKGPVKEDQDRLDSQAVDWPNVMLPNGWDDTQRLFNLDGYGPTLINPDGIVLGVNIQPEEVERLIAKDTHSPR